MKQKNSYTYEDLINCGDGELFGKGNAKLPLPPMLMFDRITEIQKDTGKFKKGHMKSQYLGSYQIMKSLQLIVLIGFWSFLKTPFQKRL